MKTNTAAQTGDEGEGETGCEMYSVPDLAGGLGIIGPHRRFLARALVSHAEQKQNNTPADAILRTGSCSSVDNQA